jgi:hypothetical protein
VTNDSGSESIDCGYIYHVYCTVYLIYGARGDEGRSVRPGISGGKQQHIATDMVTTARSICWILAGPGLGRQAVPTYIVRMYYNISRSSTNTDNVMPSFSIVDRCALGDIPCFRFGKRGTDEGAHIAARTGIICKEM